MSTSHPFPVHPTELRAGDILDREGWILHTAVAVVQEHYFTRVTVRTSTGREYEATFASEVRGAVLVQGRSHGPSFRAPGRLDTGEVIL